MTIKFYEFGNSVVFGRQELEKKPSCWENVLSVGDKALYHDSKNGTRPLGQVVSISPDREYLLVRLAGYELFIVLRKLNQSDYVVMKSDIRAMTETTGKKYYEGTAQLQTVDWLTDPEGNDHILFIWFLNDVHKMHVDVVNIEPEDGNSPLVDFISGRYEITE